MDKIIFQDKFS